MTEQQIETLWQIGKPGQFGKEFVQAGGWQAEFTYTVGCDQDPIERPTMPAVLVVPEKKHKPERKGKPLFSTDKLNIRFSLERDYGVGELTLFYDFLGSETDSLFLDGEKLTELPGAGEGKLKQNQVPFGAVAKGEHVLTLTTAAGKSKDHYHWIDCIKLQAVVPVALAAEPLSPSAPLIGVAPTKTSEPDGSKEDARAEAVGEVQMVEQAKEAGEPVAASTTNPVRAETEAEMTDAQPSSVDSDRHIPVAQPRTMTVGLEDYAYWCKVIAQEQANKGKAKQEFRRGRIWT